ncbi:hypothetical protein HOY82DRAFT_495139 [Tuber indicum]|nr:hypothetical protein HOY82DRAFT_495139 [Tuber indicum]
MDNYFGKAANRAPIIVPEFVKPRGKGKAAAVEKSPALAPKAKVKKERAPETPVPKKSAKAHSRSAKGTDDESDFVVSGDAGDAESEATDDVFPTEDEGDSGAAIDDEIDDIVVDKPKSKSKTRVTATGKVKHVSVSKPSGLKIIPREGDLPPISDLQQMFDDIVSRLPDLKSLFGKSGGRKLRVATMCSGTESPLLALGLMGRSMRSQGIGKLDIEHVFSCEIELYKQAYIERNFKPPILFRDVRELGEDVATTAYGAKVPIPGNVDLLIAGTSCVDFSNLNNKKKGLEDVGESSDTFHGMMRWAIRHRPTVIIQENVQGAAWTQMRAEYVEAGYSAEFVSNFDSKNYYVPQTRQRGYLFAVDKAGSGIPNRWIDAMKSLRRPATCTLEAFLLPSDDPRIHQVRMDLATKRDGSKKTARSVEWEKCEGRHQKERLQQKLGLKRPMTQWEEGGVCKMLDFAWQDWGAMQVDRVLDLMDINMLTLAKEGIDCNYKEQFWNLSQNVDRNTFGKANGICPCLTPHMIPYLTDRGGPMIGLEALAMQGLPINELLLTRESTQELQNLAGNAMTSTVVGTATLVALLLSKNVLRPPNDDGMDVDVDDLDISTRIGGDEQLKQRPLDLSTTQAFKISDLLKLALRSSRLCVCEGRSDMTSSLLSRCEECGFSSCERCGGRPEHVYKALSVHDRLAPLTFEDMLKGVLPMRLVVAGITEKFLESLKTANPTAAGHISTKDWGIFISLILDATSGEFRFTNLKRQQIWSVSYDAPAAKLELLLDPSQPEWRLFAKCPTSEGVNSRKRAMCKAPMARMRLSNAQDIMDCGVEVCLPTRYDFNLTLEGEGDLVESWQAQLGLQDSKFAEKKVWSYIRMTVPDEAKECLDRDLSGLWKLLPACGTSNGALHKQVDSDGGAQLFFFLDPTKCGEPKHDPFVFSVSPRRYAYGEQRPLVAKLDPKFRTFGDNTPRVVRCHVDGQWVVAKGSTLKPPSASTQTVGRAIYATPGKKGLEISVTKASCAAANAILTCRVPLENQAEGVWPKGVWKQVDKIHERNTFESLAWLTERVRSMRHLSNWNALDLPEDHTSCERCAPTPPNLRWVMKGNKFVPMEDAKQAAPYELALKNRPSPFVTQLMLEDDSTGILRIGLNIPTLVHRALSRLPSEGREEMPMLSWRLTTDYIPETQLTLPAFELTSNKKDQQHTQPPRFITKLRPEQLRSLSWMMTQEEEDAIPFVEEEISEALLPHLNWRAEGKAERPIQVRGGVLADQVGYGKTAITLGLIDCSRDDVKLPEDVDGCIPVKATLIIVPAHLTNQWPAEINKFTGSNTYKVIKIQSQAHLNALTIAQVMDADIIVVASTLFRSDKYLGNLAGFAATRPVPSSEGRRFNAWQKVALRDLKEQVNNLRGGGAEFVRQRIDDNAKGVNDEDSSAEEIMRNKRLIGKAYVEAVEKQAQAGGKRKRPKVEVSDGEFSSSASGSGPSKRSKMAPVVVGDPWGLRTNAVARDWKRMHAPPFEMFHFNRLVVDEYTYLKGQIHAGITCLKSTFRWVLSGTPPLDDFADVKTISVFLGIHLGIDDDMVGKIDNRKKIKKDRTSVEAFTAFRELRSPGWHTRRHEIAQNFLNQFVRQNIAEIDEIPFEEHIVPITLPAAERAIYLELEHHLQALEMNIRKSKIKVDNDRDKRLQESLGDSASAEEALLKRCSHFVLDFTKEDEENAVQACEVIVKDRKRQLTSCREEIRQRLVDCLKRHREIPKDSFPIASGDHFGTFLKTTLENGIGDPEAGEDIVALINQAKGNGRGPKPFSGIPSVVGVDFLKPVKSSKKTKGKGKADDDDDDVEVYIEPWPKAMEDKVQQLRDRTAVLRALVRKELVGRHRSLRYFRIVRDLQQFGLAEFAKKNSVSNVSCPGCKRKNLPVSEIAVLSSCGHQGCYTCLEAAAHKQECLTPGCDSAARVLNVVKGESLGTEDAKEGIGRHYGMKLEKMMHLIQKLIPVDEKILVFVQFTDLMEKVAQVLKEYKIGFLQIKGSAAAQSKALQQFQESAEKDNIKVLLLNVMDESASGANLTNANHAIFLSPLLTTTDYEYRSCETQAIGRVRRYGQTKKVHVWRFLTENSIDVEIFQDRGGAKFADVEKFVM